MPARVERGEPRARLRRAVEARQRDQRHVVGARRGRVALAAPRRLRCRACPTECAARQLAIGEQAELASRRGTRPSRSGARRRAPRARCSRPRAPRRGPRRRPRAPAAARRRGRRRAAPTPRARCAGQILDAQSAPWGRCARSGGLARRRSRRRSAARCRAASRDSRRFSCASRRAPRSRCSDGAAHGDLAGRQPVVARRVVHAERHALEQLRTRARARRATATDLLVVDHQRNVEHDLRRLRVVDHLRAAAARERAPQLEADHAASRSRSRNGVEAGRWPRRAGGSRTRRAPWPHAASRRAGRNDGTSRRRHAALDDDVDQAAGHHDDLLHRRALRRTSRLRRAAARPPRSRSCRRSPARRSVPRSLPLTCSISSISSCTSAAGRPAARARRAVAVRAGVAELLPQRMRDVRRDRVQHAQQDAEALAQRRSAAPARRRRRSLPARSASSSRPRRRCCIACARSRSRPAQHGGSRGAAPCAPSRQLAPAPPARARSRRRALAPKSQTRRRKRFAPSTPASFHSSVCFGRRREHREQARGVGAVLSIRSCGSTPLFLDFDIVSDAVVRRPACRRPSASPPIDACRCSSRTMSTSCGPEVVACRPSSLRAQKTSFSTMPCVSSLRERLVDLRPGPCRASPWSRSARRAGAGSRARCRRCTGPSASSTRAPSPTIASSCFGSQ